MEKNDKFNIKMNLALFGIQPFKWDHKRGLQFDCDELRLTLLTPNNYTRLIRLFNNYIYTITDKFTYTFDLTIHGEVRWFCASIVQEKRDQSNHVYELIGKVEDVTETEHSINHYKDLAYKDTLTGYYNRLGLEHQLDLIDKDEALSLFFIDLDNFKKLNDLYGHDTGDEMLKHVANSMDATLPDHAHLARVSGDEFVIVIQNRYMKSSLNTIAKDILAAIVKANDKSIIDDATLTGSIGVALYPQDSSDIHACINKADQAMYVAKKNGKANFILYNNEIKKRYFDYKKEHQFLLQAFRNNEFKVSLQPIYDMKAQKIEMFELLPFWEHPNKGALTSNQFLHKLYEEGLIFSFDEWMIEEAIKQIAQLKLTDIDMKLSINISPKHLAMEHFHKFVEEKLMQYNVSGQSLYIEMVEFILEENFEIMNYNFKKLQQLGIKIIIDGFGINESSISRMRTMHFDMIKINKYFIETLTREYSSIIILETIIKLASEHQKEFIAEGIIEREQFEKIQTYDVRYAQGAYLSEPKPIDAIIEMIKRATKI